MPIYIPNENICFAFSDVLHFVIRIQHKHTHIMRQIMLVYTKQSVEIAESTRDNWKASQFRSQSMQLHI